VVHGRYALSACDRGLELVLAETRGVALDSPATIVETVDAHRDELRGKGVDLAQKVLGGEPALAERVGRGVRRGGDACARGSEPGEESGHEAGVPRIVKLELVYADEARALQQRRRARVAESPDERRVLDEGAKVFA